MRWAALSGLLVGAAFLPHVPGAIALVGFVPLLFTLDREVKAGSGLRRLFSIGFVFGLVNYALGVHWIALLSDVATTVPWIKYPAWLAAAAYLSVFAGIATAVTGGLARAARLPLALVMPAVFLAVEELRASGEMGFPWFQPGYSQHAYLPIVQMASLGSVTLVTLWVYGVNVLLWRTLAGPARAPYAAWTVLLVLLPWFWGMRALDAGPREQGPRIALIQGNVPGAMKWSGRHQTEILDRFLERTAAAAESAGAQPLAMAIWPETATGSYLRKQLDQTYRVLNLSASLNLPIAAGFPDYELGADGKPRYVNGAAVFRPAGTSTPVYAKQHLVPFGERIPFQHLIPALGRVDFGQAEWTPGTSRPLFEGAGGRFGFLICFESIFPDLARRDALAGATWLVNITNDEWFGNSAALYQHAAMAVFRSAENHLPLARCANTGLSFITDSRGRIVATAPVWQVATVIAPLTPPGPRTPYTQFGDWPGILAGLAVAAFAVTAGLRALTRRGART